MWITGRSATNQPQAFRKYPADLPDRLRAWMAAEHPYTVRFAIGGLMSFYLDHD